MRLARSLVWFCLVSKQQAFSEISPFSASSQIRGLMELPTGPASSTATLMITSHEDFQWLFVTIAKLADMVNVNQ